MASASDYTPTVENVLAVWDSATPEQIEAGTNWYRDAWLVSQQLADANGIDPIIVAGIIAALSPLNSWGNNINLAARFLDQRGTMTTGYLKSNLKKAGEIYRLNRDSDQLQAQTIMDILKGDKTTNFFLSIISSGREGVCIDRHAYSLAVNHRFSDTDPTNQLPRLTTKHYNAVVDIYTEAAQSVGVGAAVMQSVTWTVWRQRFWQAGAFDKYEEI